MAKKKTHHIWKVEKSSRELSGNQGVEWSTRGSRGFLKASVSEQGVLDFQVPPPNIHRRER